MYSRLPTNSAVNPAGNGRGVQHSSSWGGQAGQGAADDGADVVHAGLQGGEAHVVQALPDVKHVANFVLAQLDLLAGSQVGKPFAVVIADAGDGAELGGVADAVGHTQPHHKTARGFAGGRKMPAHFNRSRSSSGTDCLALFGEGGNILQDVQAILGGFHNFDFVHRPFSLGNGIATHLRLYPITLDDRYCVGIAAALGVRKGLKKPPRHPAPGPVERVWPARRLM